VRDLVTREFAALGFSMLHFNDKPNANGPDCWVHKEGKRPLSVEIKRARRMKNKTLQVECIHKSRASDDLIAIIFNTEYVLIEPMKDHLKSCSPKGTRQFTIMS